MFAPVYFDHNASTPTDPAVLEAMLPYLSAQFGNASSRHEYGRAARRAIDEARSQVAAAVGAHASEVVFTSGGSEANNLLIKGAAACLKPGLLAVSAIEHPCVIKPAEQLCKRGWMLEKLAVDADGRVDVGHFAEVMARKPKIVSVILANNETGVLQDVESLADCARMAGAWFHTDAVQAVGKLAVDFRRLNAAGVHALTLSAHKIGGPKGAAALVLDKRVELEPLIAGGGHERGLRSGTENVASIVGFGVACTLATERRVRLAQRLLELRGQLEAGLLGLGATLFGQAAERLPNTVYFSFPELDGETLVGHLDRAGYAVASGAACSSANPEPSHVLRAMGVDPELARGAVRVSLGRGNSKEQVAGFLNTLQATIAGLQRLSAMSA
ncbi:MAG: cysteine desulfurase family protein [Candidatus Accumulibacter phosphatis]|jgi:cysteine desulfurase|uniref:cysteine desulfurase n=1 Tax=Candidatus Accumulibacter contiguus TaxID=2954381 RepID=A0ABX1TCA7_9PROT|nr:MULTISPECIES: cysteine desulfurase family protein [Candidatus Accumulibacter]MBL8409030.1 cysteine desulfurase [Accumulibacter sp.]NMQ07324.1 cysteine desulfurase [Candidatus Accumulibacter contiguus]HRF12752.1 cysteine desulfurase family protein [Candidatus Accumulibacter phosphatis]